MGVLSANDRLQLSKRLASLAGPVRLIAFTGGEADPGLVESGRIVGQLARELGELSEKIQVEVTEAEAERVRYGIERTPALALARADGTDTRIRFYGIPGGYEFATLLADLEDVAADRIALAPETVQALAALQQPVSITVFSTPG